MVSKWETIEKFDGPSFLGDENTGPLMHPIIYSETIADMINNLYDLIHRYQGNYDEVRLESCSEAHGYGAMSYWWEIQGRYTDQTKIILYGKK